MAATQSHLYQRRSQPATYFYPRGGDKVAEDESCFARKCVGCRAWPHPRTRALGTEGAGERWRPANPRPIPSPTDAGDML
eukprot:scaffold1034_cov418-Prasinococcus_capsulatus_cf.AAC.35